MTMFFGMTTTSRFIVAQSIRPRRASRPRRRAGKADIKPAGGANGRDQNSHNLAGDSPNDSGSMLTPSKNLNWYEVARGDSLCVKSNMGLREVVWVFLATSERWKHACEHLEPQIFLVA